MKNNYFKKREKNAHEGDRIGLRGRRNMTEQLNAATENNDPSAPSMHPGRLSVWMPIISVSTQ